MVPVKPEETLHHYLRRHFEKLSKGMARKFAEETKALPHTASSQGSWQPYLREILFAPKESADHAESSLRLARTEIQPASGPRVE